MKRAWLTRGAALGAGALLLAATLGLPSAENTSAGWNDVQASSATMSALTVPGVESTTCSGTSSELLVAATATISWPAVAATPNGSVSYVVKVTNSAGETTTFPQPETSRLFKVGLMDLLLGALISDPTTLTIEVQAVHTFASGASWTASTSSIRRIDYMGSLLGIGGGYVCA